MKNTAIPEDKLLRYRVFDANGSAGGSIVAKSFKGKTVVYTKKTNEDSGSDWYYKDEELVANEKEPTNISEIEKESVQSSDVEGSQEENSNTTHKVGKLSANKKGPTVLPKKEKTKSVQPLNVESSQEENSNTTHKVGKLSANKKGPTVLPKK